jgi:predicted N-acetyltransferase YhbS
MTINNLQIRLAKESDIPHIVKLLSEDDLTGNREEYSEVIPSYYVDAFRKIDSDPNNELVVAVMDQKIVGTLQLTYIPYILLQGSTRALMEAVIVTSKLRSQGIGTRMMRWAIQRSKQKGCKIVQLTSNKKRKKAHVFYKRLGFNATHEGFKLFL